MRGKSLISRLAATTALMATVIVAVAVVFFQLSHWSLFRRAFGNALEDWCVVMAARIGDDPEIAAKAARTHRLGILLELDGETLAFAPDGSRRDPSELVGELAGSRRIEVDGHGGQRYSFFLEPTDDAAATFHRTLLAGFVLLLLLTIGIVYVVQLSQLRPLRWLQEGVEAVSRGDLSTRVPIARDDEIGRVGRAFNRMAARLEEMIADRERLLADVAHELRSPLSRIKVALELLPDSARLGAIDRDVRQMESLTHLLLERERLAGQIGDGPREAVDLAAVAREVVAHYRGDAPEIDLEAPAQPLLLEADPALLRMLLSNLVDNAVKFSLADSQPVRVRVRRTAEEAEVVVDDDGTGIPRAAIERVFDPFVKLDPARGHGRGWGLGLDLCRRIAEVHQGTIELQARAGRGTRARVVLPLR